MTNLYKFIWSRTLKRPFTYIIRDSWADGEVYWIIGLLALGAVLGKYFTVDTLLKALGVFLAGVLVGHLFWGSSFIKGQKGD